MGFRIGAGAGFAGFVMLIVLTASLVVGLHQQNQLRSELVQQVRDAEQRYADPEARQSLEYFVTPDGLVTFMIFGSLIMCVLFVIFSGIGGALSAAYLRRKRD